MQNQLDVGLLWHSDNSGNLGVGALTVGNMALAGQAAREAGVGLRFHLFKAGDSGPSYITDGIASRHAINGRYTASPNGLWRDLKRMDAVLDISAGDSFTDIYPNKRFFYQALTKWMVYRAGVPLILSPQTIGPFSRQPHSRVAARILRRATAVFARDRQSEEAARRLAPDATIIPTIDVAFALPFTRPAHGDRPQFGVNVSGLLYSHGYTGKNEFGLEIDYREFTHRLIEAVLARGDTDVVLFKHVYAPHLPADDDARAARILHERYPATILGPDFSTPSDAKSFASGLDFLVAGRMHASIAAFSAGTPVVPFSYSRKFEGLYGALGYQRLIPSRGMSLEDALARTLDAYTNRAAVAAEVAAGNARATELLDNYTTRLAQIFRSISTTGKGA